MKNVEATFKYLYTKYFIVVYKMPYRRARAWPSGCIYRVYRTKKLAPTIVGANRLRNISKKLNAAQSVFEVFFVKLIISY